MRRPWRSTDAGETRRCTCICRWLPISAQLNRMEEAGAARLSFEAGHSGGADLEFYAATHAAMCRRPEDAAHWLEGYRKAGLVD